MKYLSCNSVTNTYVPRDAPRNGWVLDSSKETATLPLTLLEGNPGVGQQNTCFHWNERDSSSIVVFHRKGKEGKDGEEGEKGW